MKTFRIVHPSRVSFLFSCSSVVERLWNLLEVTKADHQWIGTFPLQ